MAVAASSAFAQAPQGVPIKGRILSADSNAIVVKAGDVDQKVGLAEKTTVLTLGPGTIADIKKGSYIGVGATPQADGTQKAIRVMIFAESQRGTGEGHRPWDRPNTTMTNATVDTMVSGVEGNVLTVKYKDGEKKIIIGPDAVILLRTDGSRADLKAGANVNLTATKKDTALETNRVDVGRGDFVP